MSTTSDGPPTGTAVLAADPISGALVSVRALLSTLGETPMWSLTESQLQANLSELLAVRAQLEQLTSRVLASAESREIPRIAGCSSTRRGDVEGAGLGR